MNIVNSIPLAFADLLQKTLRCSRYAKRALETDQNLLGWLQENYATSCSRAEMRDCTMWRNFPATNPANFGLSQVPVWHNGCSAGSFAASRRRPRESSSRYSWVP